MDDRLEFAPCGYLSFRDDGTVTAINATMLDMLGYEREDVLGRHLEHLLTVGTRIFYQTHWFPLLRLHGRAEEIFLLMRPKRGGDLGVLVNAVRRERDGATAYDCIAMQVRERRQYEDELLRARRAAEQARAELQAQTEEAERLRAAAEAANRAKSEFLAVMSHELRTPLNAIAGYAQLLEMEVHGPINDPQKEMLERIVKSQSHLLRLINDVLDLSRIEAGRLEFTIEPVRVAEVVAEVTPMVEPQFESRGITLTVSVDPDLVLLGDREKVQQILINLLGNAVKFTPSGGRVDLEVVRSEEAAGRGLLRVRDTGIGVPADKLDSIFQPFVQVHRGGREASEGSGLGLAISRDMARGMGGDLTASSSPGEGSAFTLVLPLPGEERDQPADHIDSSTTP